MHQGLVRWTLYALCLKWLFLLIIFHYGYFYDFLKMLLKINSVDDMGIMVGNWTESFQGGTAPSDWTGSAAILRRFAQNNQPVCFGQCWVFAGVTATGSFWKIFGMLGFELVTLSISLIFYSKKLSWLSDASVGDTLQGGHKFCVGPRLLGFGKSEHFCEE